MNSEKGAPGESAEAESLAPRRPLVTFRDSLFVRFGLLALIVVILFALGHLLFGVRPIAQQIADSQFDAAARQVEFSLRRLFSPAETLIDMASQWALSPGFSTDHPDTFNLFFMPILSRRPELTSVVAGSSDGAGWLLLQLPDGRWRNRLTDIPRRGQEQHFYEWQGGSARTFERKTLDYDPRLRPWFSGALATSEEAQPHWTAPYAFLTTGEPGITVSARRELPDGRTHVVGFDIKLLDISRTTSAITVGRNGCVLVLTEDGRVLGLPTGSAPLTHAELILHPVEALSIEPISAGVRAWRGASQLQNEILRYTANGSSWLATFRPFALGEQTFWVAVLAPESDFFPSIQPMLRVFSVIVLIVLGLTLLLARRQARQFSIPLEALVAENERISQLNFSERTSPPIRYQEFHQLVQTQKSMRSILSEFRQTLEAQACKLRDTLDEKQAILDNALVGILLVKDHMILQHNRRASELLGYEETGLVEMGTQELFADPEAYAATILRMNALLQRDESFVDELWLKRKDGSLIWGHLSGRALDRRNPAAGAVWILSDLTEQKKAKDQLDYLGYHDPLTGLPNRYLLHDRLEHAIQRAERNKELLALLFIDLDQFKIINDTLGHEAGDQLLCAAAGRLKSVLRSADTLARMGGDEFMVLIESLTDPARVVDIGNKLLEAFAEPFSLDERHLFMTTSFGISIYPNDGTDGKTLLRNADAAMYQAKTQGRNAYHFYSQEMTANALARMEIEETLRHALQHGGLELHFQPQIRLSDGAVVGAEALVRLRHPQKGLVPPLEFIPVAEDSGLIFALGQWVLEESCRTWSALAQHGYHLPRMAANVSAKQLQRREFLDTVKSVLSAADLPAETLELEVTESAFLESDSGFELLCSLGMLGVTLAIDDFGTGYSSLSYLKRLPFRKLKIDKSFIRDIGQAEEGETLVRTIINMAGTLGLEVIAEGVETQAQADFLLREGCPVAQGYLFSKPLPKDLFVDWLAQLKAGSSETVMDSGAYI